MTSAAHPVIASAINSAFAHVDEHLMMVESAWKIMGVEFMNPQLPTPMLDRLDDGEKERFRQFLTDNGYIVTTDKT